MALSDDGYTLAVCAGGEASNASGVNGNQTDNSSPRSGAVYVFRRRGNSWQQEAYLKAGRESARAAASVPSTRHGVALSADGSILVAGAPAEDVNGFENVGAVYIFRRAGTVWSLMTRLDSPQRQRRDHFGIQPEISDDGRTLKVMSLMPENEEGLVAVHHPHLRALWKHLAAFLHPPALGQCRNLPDCAAER